MEFNLSVAELHYSSVTVHANSLPEAIDKILSPTRNDVIHYWDDVDMCCTLPPSKEHPWQDVDTDRDIQCRNER